MHTQDKGETKPQESKSPKLGAEELCLPDTRRKGVTVNSEDTTPLLLPYTPTALVPRLVMVDVGNVWWCVVVLVAGAVLGGVADEDTL